MKWRIKIATIYFDGVNLRNNVSEASSTVMVIVSESWIALSGAGTRRVDM
jgi:hypothetical protein